MLRPKRLRPDVHRDGAPTPDAVADFVACCAADALMAIFGMHQSCSCGGTGCAERLSLDGTYTIATRCHCGTDPHVEALAEWVDEAGGAA